MAQVVREQVVDLAVTENCGRVAAVYSSGRVDLFDLTTGNLIWSPGAKSAYAGRYRLALSPDGRFLASTGADNVFRICDLDLRVFPVTYPLTRSGMSIAYSPDGRFVACGNDRVRVFDVRSKELVHELAGDNGTDSLQFSPDGRHLASGNWNRSVQLFDLHSESLRVLLGHRYGVQSVAFSADGKTLISVDGGYADDSIQLWDVETGESFGTLTIPLLPASKHRPERRVIATASHLIVCDIAATDAELFVWDLASRDQARTGEAR